MGEIWVEFAASTADFTGGGLCSYLQGFDKKNWFHSRPENVVG